MKTKLFISFFLSFFWINAQEIVNIPDANFKNALLNHNPVVDLNNDGEIQVSEAEAYTETLNLDSQNIADLTGIEAFVNLTGLSVANNALQTLNLSANTALETLYCSTNQLTTLDLAAQTNLTQLYCAYNQLTEIQNITVLENLTQLNCSHNQIQNLDLSQNGNLSWLWINDNQLTNVNLQNGNNANISIFDARNNPDLTCIYVDDAAYATENWSNIDAQTHFVETQDQCDYYNLVYVPDYNFEEYLETHDSLGNTVNIGDVSSMGNGVSYDHYVYEGAIKTVDSLDVQNLAIADLTGIEHFTALRYLDCSQNELEALNVTNNLQLETLLANENQISQIDLTQNTQLKEINFYANNLSDINLQSNSLIEIARLSQNELQSLDVSGLSHLEYLLASQNNLQTIDVSNCTNLFYLEVSGNQLSNIDLSTCSNLYYFYAHFNLFTQIDVSQNTNLGRFECMGNQLTQINLQNNPKLYWVNFSSNQLTELDLHNNNLLRYIYVNDNQLQQFDFRNGNNTIVEDFDATNNPDLTCIYVDDAAYATENWSNIDAQTHFVETQDQCDYYNLVYVPDYNFEEYLETHDSLGNTVNIGDVSSMGNGVSYDHYVYEGAIKTVDSLDVQNLAIADLTGIEHFTALRYLDCSQNELETLNVTNNLQLETLLANENQISQIDLTQNTQLKEINFYANNLSDINLQSNSLIEIARLSQNELQSLDVSGLSHLEYLLASQNNLQTIDVSNCTNLFYLEVSGNQLSNIDLSTCSNLYYFYAHFNLFAQIDVSQNTNLGRFECMGNQLTQINLQNNPKLYWVNFSSNQLTELDLHNNNLLRYVYVNDNQLQQFDFRNGNNTIVEDFDATNNPDLTCIYVDDATYATENWSNIDAQTKFVETESDCEALAIDENTNSELSIYPNPAQDFLQINSDTNIEKIQIYNLQGQLVKTQKATTTTTTIDISTLPKGVFLIKIQLPEFEKTAMFIKQ